MFFYNKKLNNRILILQVFLLLLYIVSSYSLSNSYYKKSFEQSKSQSQITEYVFSSSNDYYLTPTNRNIHLKSLSFLYNLLISWLVLAFILNLSQNQKKHVNYHNRNLGLYKRLKNILNPKYHRSKYKAYLTMQLEI